MSDLVGDFVVLVCWTVSRKPPTSRFQFGFGKFESLGSLVVAVFLLLGGAGIGKPSGFLSPSRKDVERHSDSGLHSYESLRSFLWPDQHHPSASSHSHSHELVDPHAAWFALGSIAVKEYLYRKSAPPSLVFDWQGAESDATRSPSGRQAGEVQCA